MSDVVINVTITAPGHEVRLSKVTLNDAEWESLPENPVFKQAFQLLHLQISEAIFSENKPQWHSPDGELVEVFKFGDPSPWIFPPEWLADALEKETGHDPLDLGECLVRYPNGDTRRVASDAGFERL